MSTQLIRQFLWRVKEKFACVPNANFHADLAEKVSEIAKKFKQYNSDLFEVWEDYLLLDFYLPHIHDSIKKEVIPDLPFDSLFTAKKVPFTKNLFTESSIG